MILAGAEVDQLLMVGFVLDDESRGELLGGDVGGDERDAGGDLQGFAMFGRWEYLEVELVEHGGAFGFD